MGDEDYKVVSWASLPQAQTSVTDVHCEAPVRGSKKPLQSEWPSASTVSTIAARSSKSRQAYPRMDSYVLEETVIITRSQRRVSALCAKPWRANVSAHFHCTPEKQASCGPQQSRHWTPEPTCCDHEFRRQTPCPPPTNRDALD